MSAKKGTSKYDPYKEWILDHKDDYYTLTELMDALKINFGVDVNRNSLKAWFRRTMGITTIYGTHEFTSEEIEIIKKYYPDNGSAKTAEVINDILRTNRTAQSVLAAANKHGIKVSKDYLRSKNQIAGKNMSKLITRPSGTVRKEQKNNGYVYRMKTADGRWQTAGKVIWEQANGPIPKGFKLIYLDGDNSNYQLDNLYLADYKTQYQVIRNKHYKSGDPEIVKSIIKFYELRNALGVDCWEWQNIQKKFERKFNKLIKEVSDG